MAGGRLHDEFVNTLDALTQQSLDCYRAGIGQTGRPWQQPTDWVGDPLDVPNTHKPAFDRTAANENYIQVHTSGEGGAGDAAGLKVQIDYLAVLERAFRARHATRLRSVMHAAARHKGHGQPSGVFGFVRNYAQELMKSAGG